jgi:cobaltochelatase CobS
MPTQVLVEMDVAGKVCFRCGKGIPVGDTAAVEQLPGRSVSFSHASCAAENDPKAKALIGEGKIGLDDKALAAIVDSAGEVISDFLESETTAARIKRGMSGVINSLVADAVKKLTPVHITINTPTIKVKKTATGGVFHPIFPDMVKMCAAGLNVFVPGPTGCGKTHIAKQVADALGLNFYPMSMAETSSEAHLFGRQIPNISKGTYTYYPSPLIKAFVEGGVALLDEIDASDPNILLSLNMMLDNKVAIVHADSSDPIKKQHENFRLIAGANTLGKGATQMYAGRNQLDGATLDRFSAGFLPMDYCEELDRHLLPIDDLRETLVSYREPIAQHSLHRAISCRCLRNANTLATIGYTHAQIERQVFASWTEHEIGLIRPKYRNEWKSVSA